MLAPNGFIGISVLYVYLGFPPPQGLAEADPAEGWKIERCLHRPLVLQLFAAEGQLLGREGERGGHGVAAHGVEVLAELYHVGSGELQLLHLGVLVTLLEYDAAVHALELGDHQIPQGGVVGAFDLEADGTTFHFAAGAAGGVDVTVQGVAAVQQAVGLAVHREVCAECHVRCCLGL